MASTIKDIANYTGLGLATISKYLNGGNVRKENRILIEKAIKELNFTVNEFARGLKTNKSKMIGVVIPELSNIFVTTIITIVEDILRDSGYGIVVCDCRSDEKLEKEAVQFLVNKMVDGIISMPVSHDGKHLLEPIKKQIPVLLIDRTIEKIEKQVDSVIIDNKRASFSASQHLIENGHKNIGIIIGPKEVYTSQQRLLGYKEALIQSNLLVNESMISYGNYTVSGGHASTKKLLKENKKISAILVTNYDMTLGTIIAINELGIKMPNELSIVSFDDHQLAQVVVPKLTIVTQPLIEIGQTVAQIMLKRLYNDNKHDKETIVLPTKLEYGESVLNLNAKI